jgi:hypothetical protein
VHEHGRSHKSEKKVRRLDIGWSDQYRSSSSEQGRNNQDRECCAMAE